MDKKKEIEAKVDDTTNDKLVVLEADDTALKNEVTSLKAKNAALKEEYTSLKAKNAALKEEYTSLKEENEALKEEQQEAQEVVKDLKAQMKTSKGVKSNTIKIGKEMYKVVGGFQRKGDKYTAEDIASDEKIAKELLEKGSGLIIKVN